VRFIFSIHSPQGTECVGRRYFHERKVAPSPRLLQVVARPSILFRLERVAVEENHEAAVQPSR